MKRIVFVILVSLAARCATAQISITATTGGGVQLNCTGGTGGGGISNIAWSVPSFMTATPSSIAANGTQSFTFSPQVAHLFLAGPSSGGSATPAFRALVSADLPSPLFTLSTTGNSGAATYSGGTLNIPQYSGLSYGGSVVNSIPFVSNATAPGTLGDSPLTFDGSNINNAAPLYQNGGFFLNPTNTATSGANYQSFSLNEYASYWNGSAAVTAQAQQYLWVGSGTTPAVIEDHYYPAGLTNLSVLYAQNAANVATSGANVNTPKFILRGATWTGSASQLDNWNMQGVQGTGSNPTSTLTFTHNGTSGLAAVSVPMLVTTAGVPGVQLPAAAFSTYPACATGTEGLEEAVTDSSTNAWGATVTGGGANHVKMYCDGSLWTVEAK